MKILNHPTFASDYYEYQSSQGTRLFIVFALNFMIFAVCVAYKSLPYATFPLAIGFVLVLRNQGSLNRFLNKQICPSCSNRAKLIKPSKWGQNFLSECIPCQTRWDLNLSRKDISQSTD